MKRTTTVALLSAAGVFVGVLAARPFAFAFAPTVPHQVKVGIPSKAHVADAMAGDFAALDNPLVETDGAIVPARNDLIM
ncbi:hypothetical protein ACHAXT_004892 [Thalassiosira profunda]